MTPTELITAIYAAKPGASITYHTDTHAHGETCREAWKMKESGKVALVQKRLPPVWPQRWARYAYIAQVL